MGSLNIKLTTPAYITLIAYTLLALVVILPFDIPVFDEQTNEYSVLKYEVFDRILLLLFITLPIALSVYSVNCMMVGNCELLSYLSAFLVVLWISMTVIYAFMFTFSKK